MGGLDGMGLSAHDIACATPSLAVGQSLGNGSSIRDHEGDSWGGGASMVSDEVDITACSCWG